MNRRDLLTALAIGCLLIFVASGAVIAAGKSSGQGTLTEVDEDGTVIIDEKGYLMSSSAVVQNYKGEQTSVRNLPLPSHVYFEYEYRKSGFVIILIKELPK